MAKGGISWPRLTNSQQSCLSEQCRITENLPKTSVFIVGSDTKHSVSQIYIENDDRNSN